MNNETIIILSLGLPLLIGVIMAASIAERLNGSTEKAGTWTRRIDDHTALNR